LFFTESWEKHSASVPPFWYTLYQSS